MPEQLTTRGMDGVNLTPTENKAKKKGEKMLCEAAIYEFREVEGHSGETYFQHFHVCYAKLNFDGTCPKSNRHI
jgi:hypothetical protein